MKLFIANLSRQIVQFHYRLPKDRAVWPPRVFIHPGRQVQIEGELMPEAVDAIVAQHEKYGLISMREALDMKQRTAIAYSIDTPASAEDMAALVRVNDNLATAESARIRVESAGATLAHQLSIKGLGNMRPTHIVHEVIEEKRSPDSVPGLTHIIDASRDGGPSRYSRDAGLGG